MRKVVIEGEIFEKFPDFKRGIVLVKDAQNHSSNERINALLKGEVEEKSGKDLLSEDSVKAWEEAHRKFGSNPNKFPPSIKALLKRVEKGSDLPFINSVVALFNYISVKYFIPCGGDDAEQVKGNFRLGFANGKEHFIPLGGKDPERPFEGEVIYYDDESLNVMCRRWNWKNGENTKISERTRDMIINIDGIGSITSDTTKKARDEIAYFLEKECGAKVRVDLLEKEKGEIHLD